MFWKVLRRFNLWWILLCSINLDMYFASKGSLKLKRICSHTLKGFIFIQEYIPSKKVKATASSLWSEDVWTPDKAIDGIIIPNSDANLFHSGMNKHTWFVVDLGYYFNVNITFTLSHEKDKGSFKM